MISKKRTNAILIACYLVSSFSGCQFTATSGNGQADSVAVEKIAQYRKGLGNRPLFTFEGVVPGQKTSYSDVHNITVSNQSFASTSGDGLLLKNCANVIIANCYFGPVPTGVGLRMVKCSNVVISNCFFANTGSGITLAYCKGPLTVTANQFANIIGANIRTAVPHGIILDNCSGAGISIDHNIMESYWGYANVNDQINLYQSNGTTASPILVSNNTIRGGGPDKSATGIIGGDGGNSSHQEILQNTIINTRYIGIGVAGGQFIGVRDNRLFQARNAISNVGISFWNQYPSPCMHIIGAGNKVNWTNAEGQSNNFWGGTGANNCSPQTFDSTNAFGQSLASLQVPSYLFSVSEDTLWHIIKVGKAFTPFLQIPIPSSAAGSPQSINADTAILDGSGSQSSNGLNYRWAQVSGPSQSMIGQPHEAKPAVRGLTNGIYVFRLVVGDNGNGFGTDTAYDASWTTITVTGH